MYDVLILAVALSMDAFAVSLALGASHVTKSTVLGLKVGIYFGLFQGVMPLIGFWAGESAFSWVEGWENWIAFVLLVGIGGKMIYETIIDGNEVNVTIVTHKLLIFLAIAVSIDALAAGFTLTVLDVNPYLASVIIGLATFILSVLGVWVGAKSGVWLQRKAALLGGVTLVLIGFKFLLI